MINVNRAINAGFVGATCMTFFMILMRGVGVTSMNLELMLGSMVTSETGMGSWLLGLFLHLFVGAVFGVIYGAIMEMLGRGGWAVGLAIGAVHTVLSGFILPLIGAMHPLVRSGALAPPGIFASGLGAGAVVLFILLHLGFGATVGGFYVVLARTPDEDEEAEPFPTHTRRPPSAVHRG
ncbi:MAG TPA: hypothetical protein VKW04_09370 [Planctomycetota bacterium]|nr:hypothetical protein [Planctomycetota bacterium]